jgi:hypothetical protein
LVVVDVNTPVAVPPEVAVTPVDVATVPPVDTVPELDANFAAAAGVTLTLESAILYGAMNKAADFQSLDPFEIALPSDRFSQN